MIESVRTHEPPANGSSHPPVVERLAVYDVFSTVIEPPANRPLQQDDLTSIRERIMRVSDWIDAARGTQLTPSTIP